MEDIVMVPVPRSRLLDVYAVLGDSRNPTASAAESSNELDSWDAAEIRRHVGRASDTIRRLTNYLASRPGVEVSTTEIADELGLPHGWMSVAGALGAFGRYLGNRDLDYPWESWWDADGRAVFRMTDDVAAEVLKANL